MEKVKMVCFDMDGTIANLYAVNGWLDKLRKEDATPYKEALPMWDMQKLRQALLTLISRGVEVRIITWLSMNSSETYKKAVREAKKDWLAVMGFPYTHFHAVQYGATKADSVRRYLKEGETAILIDDNEQVRNGWHLGATIDPATCNILKTLAEI